MDSLFFISLNFISNRLHHFSNHRSASASSAPDQTAPRRFLSLLTMIELSTCCCFVTNRCFVTD
ncbi:hypothetical protein Syun_017665 [Stephania yunnanensis]|uniref:Uncharacterized protein n=1 Tax=Stephania yunnanensis TaxID=152371 RepID=A0AAP0J9M3_9MAGN